MRVFFVLFFMFCTFLKGFSQSEYLLQLKDSIESLNKQNYFTLSKKILKKYIVTEAQNNTDKFYAEILYAEIFKHTDDYVNVDLHLNEAKKYAEISNKKEHCLAILHYHKTLVAFDTRNYEKAEILFDELQKNFLFLNNEEQGMLLIIKAYLAYKKHNYKEAITFYKLAETKLKEAKNEHNLPLVYQKMMAVYAQTGDSINYVKSFKMSLNYAEKYNIKKYKHITLLVLNDMIANDNHFSKMSSSKKQTFHANLLTYYNKKNTLVIEDSKKGNYTLIVVIIILVLITIAGLVLKTKAIAPSVSNSKVVLIDNDLTNNLTEKQKEVVSYIVQGKSNAEIAELLNISISTVKYHTTNIYSILNVNRRIELVNLIKNNKQA